MTELADPRSHGDDAHERDRVAAALFGAPEPVRRVGRFRITGELGRGGMGEVLAGFDEELERKVAVKWLHRHIGQEQGRRLKREAKALARLSHPNVVQVYEVGVHEDRVFVAMEHVEGDTLKQWIAKQGPTVTEAVEMFCTAARGLAAAHDVGLIHRDFKPDNVLVGADGRPRVLDFGLARSEDDALPERLLAPEELEKSVDGLGQTLETTLTATGLVLGTPAYMPPEQFVGEKATAASDQFSLCVALWEALYGGRPFEGEGLQQLGLAVVRGEIRTPPKPRGTPQLRKIVERGLSPQPGDRWPDLRRLVAALEDELVRPRRSMRRRWMMGLGAALLAASAVALAWTRPWAPADAPLSGLCLPTEERFAGIWDDAVQVELAAKYQAGALRGKQWWGYERALLDDWVAQWSGIYEQSCRDEAARDLPRFALRQTCLDQRMVEIRTRVELLRKLDPGARADAAAIDYLPFYLPAECQNEALVSAVPLYPSDEKERREVIDAMVALRVSEGTAQAAYVSGTPQEVRQSRADFFDVAKRVEVTGFEPAIAELKLRTGNGLLVANATPDEGFADLDDAVRAARRSRAELIRVLAEVWRLEHQGLHGDDRMAGSEVEADFEDWSAGLESVGSPTYGIIEVAMLRARHHIEVDDPEAVARDAEEAVAAAVAAYGEDSSFTKMTLFNAAEVLTDAGLDERAVAARSRAIGIVVRLFGDDSAQLHLLLRGQAEHALRLGDHPAMLDAMKRRVEVMKRHYEPESVAVARTEIDLARAWMVLGDYDEAAEILRELDPRGAEYSADLADAWSLVHLFYAALAGAPNEATKVAADHPDNYPEAKALGALMKPVIDGVAPAEAAAALEKGIEAEHWPMAKSAAFIQLGRIREVLGQPQEARVAYESALAIDTTPDNLAFSNYHPVFQFAARAGLARLDTP